MTPAVPLEGMVTTLPWAGVDQRRISWRRGLSGVAGLLFVLAGCSGDESSMSIESIEPILVGEIAIEADPSGTSASLLVETSVPVACSVIFGIDDAFGSIAVDNDMQGGAHEDHSPLLVGLVPDTEYQYRLQGSDAVGTLYRSEIMRFRTPPAEETGLGPNVAPEGTVTGASSSFSDQFGPENGIDGDLATEWSSLGDGDDAWIEIDLGSERDLSGVMFRTREMSDGTAVIETFTITIDGSQLGPFPTGSDPINFSDSVVGRVLRFDAEQTTGGNTGATEIEIYSSP